MFNVLKMLAINQSIHFALQIGKSYSCYVLESIRKQSKDKKAANALQNVEVIVIV